MAMPRSRGAHVVDVAAVDADLAAGDVLEAGDHAQQRGLAAAGRADEDDELAMLDGQVDALDDLDRAIALANALEFETGHVRFSASAAARRLLSWLSLDRALQQRGDELLLEDQEQGDGRSEDEQRPGAEQRNVGSPLPLEGAERAGHRALQRVATRTTGRRNWFQVHRNRRIDSDMIAGLRDRNLYQPEMLPAGGAVDLRRLAQFGGTFTKCARIQ